MERPSSVLTDGHARVDRLKAVVADLLGEAAVPWSGVAAAIERAARGEGRPVIAWQVAPPAGRDHGEGWSVSLRFTAFGSRASDDEISAALFAAWEAVQPAELAECTDLRLACGEAVHGQGGDGLRRGSLTVHIREVRTG